MFRSFARPVHHSFAGRAKHSNSVDEQVVLCCMFVALVRCRLAVTQEVVRKFERLALHTSAKRVVRSFVAGWATGAPLERVKHTGLAASLVAVEDMWPRRQYRPVCSRLVVAGIEAWATGRIASS